jgi:hypothetical protein
VALAAPALRVSRLAVQRVVMRFMVVPHKGFSIETKPAGRLRRCLDETPVSYTREERSWMSAEENIFSAG